MALLQYAERYPVGQRQVKMLDETLESATAGLRGEEVFKSVILHLPRFKLILSCGGKELMKELLDPDYIPGSLKHIPQGSIETISASNPAASSASSPKTSSRGLPVTPDTHFMEQAKMRGRADTLRRSAGDASEPLSIDSAGLPLPLSSFDEEVEQVAQTMSALPHQANSSDSTRNIGSSSNSLGLGQSGDTPTTEAYQTFMAMAMNMSNNQGTTGHADFDFGLGADNAGDFGFGFDINNFSFDTSDFSALLGQPPQGDGQGGSAYGS